MRGIVRSRALHAYRRVTSETIVIMRQAYRRALALARTRAAQWRLRGVLSYC